MQFTKALQHTIVWKALNTVLTFCINLLLVRIMGAEYSGMFFYAIAMLTFFTLVISWSIESGITYYGSNEPVNIISLSIVILPLLLLQAGISWLLLGFIETPIDKTLCWLFIISNLAIVYFSALYYAQKKFLSLNLVVCGVNILVLLVLYYLFFRPHTIASNEVFNKLSIPTWRNNFDDNAGKIYSSFYWVPFIYFSGFLLQAIILVIFFFSRPGLKISPIKIPVVLIKKVLAYSSVALISNILFFLVTRVDYYFVQKYCDEVALSNYVQVSKLGQLLILLPSMMAAVIFPYSSGKDDADYLDKLKVLCRIISLLFIPAALVIIIGGYWFFPWLFGPGFNFMYPAFLWYLPGFYSLSIVTLLAAYLAGKAMILSNMKASLAALMVVITGDILLIPVWGIYAAAVVSSAAYIACLAYLLWVYKIKLGVKVADFFVFKTGDFKTIFSKASINN